MYPPAVGSKRFCMRILPLFVTALPNISRNASVMKCKSDNCIKVSSTAGSYLRFVPQLALAPTRLAGSVMALARIPD